MSDHTQAIPRVGGSSSGSQNQAPQPSTGYPPKSSSPSGTPSNGSAAARTNVRTGSRPGSNSPAWSPTQPASTGMTSVSSAGQAGAGATPTKNARSNQKGARAPRKARLQLRHIDTWSAMKISLVLSIVMFFVWMVAVGILYGVLSGLGVFSAINDTVGQLGGESGAATDLITPGLVFGGAALIGAINIVLFTALATIATYIYNLSADLVGGLEVTLTERE